MHSQAREAGAKFNLPIPHLVRWRMGEGNDWQPQRNLGIAALDRRAVDALLGNWAAGHPGQHVEAVEVRECSVPAREDGRAWWVSPDLEDELVSD